VVWTYKKPETASFAESILINVFDYLGIDLKSE